MAFEKQIEEHEQKRAKALAMGGPEKLARRQAAGILNVRERIDYLLDTQSWEETGLFGTSNIPEMRNKTPTDGKVTGFGRIQGREVAVVANDFTVLGASSSATNGKKIAHIKNIATRYGLPLVFLGESTGARMPDVMGAIGMGVGAHRGGGNPNPTQYLRTRQTPWATAVLGHAYGSSSWYACMSDFMVMRKGAIMAVSSPRLVGMATREQVDPEELGGWKLHAEVTGFADQVVETDQAALDAIKQFLSYLPSHQQEAPPRLPVPEGSDEASAGILQLLPQSRTQVYDVRKVIPAIVDRGSYFELKARFGKTAVTALARIAGRSVGVIANNPFFKGGALDTRACDKITSFLVLCDSFNIPLIFLVDQPGFLIGVEGERERIIGKIINWMNALSLCTVPKLMVILRKSYGQAYLNMGGNGNADEAAAWWTADVSFMDPAAAATIVSGVTQEQEPERFRVALEQMERETSAYDIAAVYGVQTVLDPRETRSYLSRMLDIHQLRLTDGVGEHRLSSWHTSY